MGENIFGNWGLMKDYYICYQKHDSEKKNIDKFDLSKGKHFCSMKDPVTRMKTQAIDWGKRSRIYK